VDDPDLRTSDGHRFRVRFRRYASPWFRYAMIPPDGFERLVAGSGWRVARLVDDGSPRNAVVLERN
jgi:hypothetical protein